MNALCEALAVPQAQSVHEGQPYYQFRHGSQYDADVITKLCDQLIFWDAFTDTVIVNPGLGHDYLHKHYCNDLQEFGGPKMAMACLTRLLFEDAASFPASPDSHIASGSKPKGLVEHALEYWPKYVKEANEDPQTRGLVAKVLLYNQRVRCTPALPLIQGYYGQETNSSSMVNLGQPSETQWPLHILLGYELVDTFDAILNCQTAAADLGLDWNEVARLGNLASKDKWGQTLLHSAAANHCKGDFIAKLLGARAKLTGTAELDVNARNTQGFTALHCAAFQGNKEAVDTLIKAGADRTIVTGVDGIHLIHLAAARGHKDIIQDLFNNAQYSSEFKVKDKKGQTGLHYATAENQTDVLKYLIKRAGLDVNAKSEFGYTPLHIAAMKGVDMALETLIENEADVRATALDEERTPLELAAKSGLIVPVEKLIWSPGRATIMMRTSLANTIEHWALLMGWDEQSTKLPNDKQCAIHKSIAEGTPLSLTQLGHMRKHFPGDPVLRLLMVRQFLDLNPPDIENATGIFEEGRDWVIRGNERTIENIFHEANRCETCKMIPIKGYRYKCTVCPCKDFCEKCYYSEVMGDHSDLFLRIPSDTQLRG